MKLILYNKNIEGAIVTLISGKKKLNWNYWKKNSIKINWNRKSWDQ
jgi:hypothetical protein